MRGTDRLAGTIIDNPRMVIAVVLVATLLFGMGATAVSLETSLEAFRGGTDAAAADDYVRENFAAGPPNATTAVVFVHSDTNTLNQRGYLDRLRFQRALQRNATVNATFPPGEYPHSLATAVATVAIQRAEGRSFDELSLADRPPIDRQIAAIEGASRSELAIHTFDAIDLLAEPGSGGPAAGPYAYVPTSYEPADDRISETATVQITQREDLPSAELTGSQVAIRAIAERELDSGRARVYGEGIINDELDRSTTDSLTLVGPIALLFMLAVLGLAYRDLLDVLLGLVGLAVVQVWTFGFMGWAGIDFNQLFVAVPVFLMGLAIDYAIHVTMRYREERTGVDPLDPRVVFLGDPADPGITGAMGGALAGVGTAFLLVTASTATGFGSNVVSPVAPVREFAVVSAVGIVAALVVFGGLVPALKVELERLLTERAADRHQLPIGRGETRFTGLLERSVTAATSTPWTVVAVALLAASIGAVGATQVDTSFQTEELLVGEVPAWAASLPGPLAPANYTTHDTLQFLKTEGIVHDRTVARLLVRGEVTSPDTLERVARARDRANRSSVTVVLGTGDNATASPVSVMHHVADEDEAFARVFERADTDDNGVPDRNLTAVYDALYRADGAAAREVVFRRDGEYRALLLTAFVDARATNAEIASELGAAAEPLDGDGLSVQPTGEAVMLAVVAGGLLQTTVRSMSLTLVVVGGMLVFVYWWTRNRPSLGVITLLPVLFAVAWILGTMWLLAIPFNVMTALIASFTIGLGVDYSIHLGERYLQELTRQGEIEPALRTSVFGTGGALLGSATTTAGGFGVLVFAILNPLQQFGAITAITIVFSFLASVVFLPSLLVIWTRRYGTDLLTARLSE